MKTSLLRLLKDTRTYTQGHKHMHTLKQAHMHICRLKHMHVLRILSHKYNHTQIYAYSPSVLSVCPAVVRETVDNGALPVIRRRIEGMGADM